MLIKMLRSQRTVFGMLHAGVAYDLPEKEPAHKKSIENLLSRGFAEKTTKASLDKEKAEAEKQSRARKASAKAEDETKADKAGLDKEKAEVEKQSRARKASAKAEDEDEIKADKAGD